MKLKIFTRVRLEKSTFIWYTSLKNSTASKQLHCCPLTNELKNATWKSLLVNMFQAAKKLFRTFANVMNPPGPSGHPRIY